METKRESGRDWVERQMVRLAIEHAASSLRSVERDVTTQELREHLEHVARLLEGEAARYLRHPQRDCA